MTKVDWIALAFVALTALLGLKKGLIASALSAHRHRRRRDRRRSARAATAHGRIELALHTARGARRRGVRRGAFRDARRVPRRDGARRASAAAVTRARLGRRPRARCRRGARARLGRRCVGAPHPGPEGSAPRGAAVARPATALLGLPPSSVHEDPRARRSVPEHRGPLAPVAPPDPTLLDSPGVRRAAPQRRARARDRVRLADRRQRLGRRARRSSSPRRTSSRGRRTRSIASRARAAHAPRSSSRSTARTTSRCFACPGLRLRPLPLAQADVGPARRDPRLPGERPAHASSPDGSARRRSSSARTRTATAPSRERSRPCAATCATATRAGRRSTRPGTSRRPSSRRGSAARAASGSRSTSCASSCAAISRTPSRPAPARPRVTKQLERALGRTERRDDVDPACTRARLFDQAPRNLRADARGFGAGIAQRRLHVIGNDDARHLVVDALRELQARQRPDADEQRDRRFAAEPLEERVEVRDVEQHLRHRELRARFELALEAVELDVDVVGRGVDRDADVERASARRSRGRGSPRRCSDARAARVRPIASTS